MTVMMEVWRGIQRPLSLSACVGVCYSKNAYPAGVEWEDCARAIHIRVGCVCIRRPLLVHISVLRSAEGGARK